MVGIILLCILIVVIGISINGIWPYLIIFGVSFIIQLIVRLKEK